MNYIDDERQQNYMDISNSGKSHQSRERGGLIPVTSVILNEAEITKDDTVSYQGIPLNDITAVGYIIDYKEFEAKVKITICDFTGSIEINFFHNSDNQDIVGLNKLNYDRTKKAVQIFGTVKVYKNEKNIQGAKIITIPTINILYHRTDVIHAWLYLSGQLTELKDNMVKNSAEEARMLAMGNNSFNNGYNNNYGYGNNVKNTPAKNQGDKDMKDAINLLESYARRNRNEISVGQINGLMKKFGKKSEEIINRLINDNKLIETDGGYEIIM